MNNVELVIGGRDFLVGCGPGEEEHVRALGKVIADKVDAANARGLSEARMLLFAALLLADENDELKRSAGTATPAPADTEPPAPDPEETARLTRIAEKMEKLADLLETPLEDGAKDL
ncbi:MAG: cell division protein ZapA [Pseudomonadota bacterium]|uniref:cell division protein ZapA n=1 Tax=Novosphingobium sp. MBES04 TaxID=1206458 RepID=UPI00058003E7|nr:cell division protein ZapA [Novosphingobium sp. MBES04]MED5545614.1 cell division protein ZapA [Pseudomonadota bacterium]GAM06383.1 cell division protein ZapA [Novosphingobium sp. MBES04]